MCVSSDCTYSNGFLIFFVLDFFFSPVMFSSPHANCHLHHVSLICPQVVRQAESHSDRSFMALRLVSGPYKVAKTELEASSVTCLGSTTFKCKTPQVLAWTGEDPTSVPPPTALVCFLNLYNIMVCPSIRLSCNNQLICGLEKRQKHKTRNSQEPLESLWDCLFFPLRAAEHSLSHLQSPQGLSCLSLIIHIQHTFTLSSEEHTRTLAHTQTSKSALFYPWGVFIQQPPVSP